MDIDFLGVGWSLPVQLDTQPRVQMGASRFWKLAILKGPETLGICLLLAWNAPVQMSKYEESVRQSIWAILSTARGERVMRPNFGCRIHDHVFAPNLAGTIGQIITDVRSALVEWEPRIDILEIDMLTNPAQPNLLQISVNYQVRTTNNLFNLVYPFYLQ